METTTDDTDSVVDSIKPIKPGDIVALNGEIVMGMDLGIWNKYLCIKFSDATGYVTTEAVCEFGEMTHALNSDKEKVLKKCKYFLNVHMENLKIWDCVIT